MSGFDLSREGFFPGLEEARRIVSNAMASCDAIEDNGYLLVDYHFYSNDVNLLTRFVLEAKPQEEEWYDWRDPSRQIDDYLEEGEDESDLEFPRYGFIPGKIISLDPEDLLLQQAWAMALAERWGVEYYGITVDTRQPNA